MGSGQIGAIVIDFGAVPRPARKTRASKAQPRTGLSERSIQFDERQDGSRQKPLARAEGDHACDALSSARCGELAAGRCGNARCLRQRRLGRKPRGLCPRGGNPDGRCHVQGGGGRGESRRHTLAAWPLKAGGVCQSRWGTATAAQYIASSVGNQKMAATRGMKYRRQAKRPSGCGYNGA